MCGWSDVARGHPLRAAPRFIASDPSVPSTPPIPLPKSAAQVNRSLTSLDLRQKDITLAGARSLISMLEVNKSVTDLVVEIGHLDPHRREARSEERGTCARRPFAVAS